MDICISNTVHQSNTNCNYPIYLWSMVITMQSRSKGTIGLWEWTQWSSMMTCIQSLQHTDISSNYVMKWVLVSNLKGVDSEGLDLYWIEYEWCPPTTYLMCKMLEPSFEPSPYIYHTVWSLLTCLFLVNPSSFSSLLLLLSILLAIV